MRIVWTFIGVVSVTALVLGVVLTATVLASLVVGLAASPAAAGANKWTKFKSPVVGLDGDMFMDPNKTFQYECQWNMSDDYRVSCDVTATDGSFSTRYESSMGGGYGGLKEFKVGTFRIYGYPSVPCTVSDFRFSVM